MGGDAFALRWRGDKAGRAEGETASTLNELLEEDTGPLDRSEQEDVVLSFQKQQFDLLGKWRIFYGILCLGLATFFLYHALHQSWTPWHLKCTAQFSRVLPSWAVAMGFALSAVPMVALGLNILSRRCKDEALLRCSTFGGGDEDLCGTCGVLTSAEVRNVGFWMTVGMGLYWGIADWASDGLWRWDCSWVAASPVVFYLCEFYMEAQYRTGMEEVRKLRKLMYDYNKL